MQDETESIQTVIARRIRELRTAGGLSQEDLAEKARRYGLDWSRATVTDREAERRPVTLDEFLLLPIIFRVELDDFLFPPGTKPRPVRIGRGVIHPPGLAALFQGGFKQVSVNEVPLIQEAAREAWQQSPARGPFEKQFNKQFLPTKAHKRAYDAIRRHAKTESDRTFSTYHLHQQTRREAEKKAARRFAVAPADIVRVSYQLWGQGLAEERDERLRAKGGASTAARRGRVTRELYSELDKHLKDRRRR